jgi:hypothetical protein
MIDGDIGQVNGELQEPACLGENAPIITAKNKSGFPTISNGIVFILAS